MVCPLLVQSDTIKNGDLQFAESKPEAYLVHLKPRQQQQSTNQKSKMLLLLRLPESEQPQESFISQQTQPLLNSQNFEHGPADVQQKEQLTDFDQQFQQELSLQQNDEVDDRQNQANEEPQQQQQDVALQQVKVRKLNLISK